MIFGIKMELNAKIHIKFKNPDVTPTGFHMYVKTVGQDNESRCISSSSLGRKVSDNCLAADTWEDDIECSYSQDGDGGWDVSLDGQIIFEPRDQDDGDLEEEQQEDWGKFIQCENMVPLNTMEIEFRESGDSDPVEIESTKLISGEMQHYANAWLDEDGNWEEDGCNPPPALDQAAISCEVSSSLAVRHG
jgi:hypothetical protein